MGRIVDQSVKSTFKMTTGASVTTGDVLYATATNPNVRPYAAQTPTFTTYTDTPITTYNTVAGAASATNAIKVAYLTTGDYVIAYTSSNNAPTFQRYNSSGVAQGSLTTIETVGTIESLSISALASGNFVVAYDNGGTNVKAAVYGPTGTQLVAPFVVEAVNASSVVAAPMTGGGFVVIYNNTTTDIRYGNYNIAGVLQGSLTTLATGSYSSPNTVDAGPLSDGQVAVCYGLANGSVRYAHIGTNGSISVADTLAFTANTTQTWPRICPTSGGSYVLCVAYSTNIQNRVVSSAGVMTPSQQATAVSTATSTGRTALNIPFSLTSGAQVQVAPNSVTGGGTMVFTNNTTSYYYRFDNQGLQIGDFVSLQGPTATFAAKGIASNGNDTVITYYNSFGLPLFVRFSATTNTLTTPAIITPLNNLLSSPTLSNCLSTMYYINSNKGYFDGCTLNSGDIATVAYNGSYSSGCFLTIMGSDSRIKFQKWIIVYSGSAFNQISIAALTNGGFVVTTVTGDATCGVFAYIYDASANFVNAVRVESVVSACCSVTGLTGGGFAVVYGTTAGVKYAIYSNTGATVLAATATTITYQGNSDVLDIAGTVDGGFAIAGATAASGYQYAKYSATGTLIGTTNGLGGSGNGSTVNVVGTPDNGYVIIFNGTASQVYVSKQNAAGAQEWQIGLTPSGTVQNNQPLRITYCPLNNYLVAQCSTSGNIYQLYKINLNGVVLNATSTTTTGQSYYLATASGNLVLVPQANDNIVIIGGQNNTPQITYITLSQGYTIVGVAGESAATNTEIDVIVDGVTTLNKSYAPVTISSFGGNPSGAKGLITGLTAELTRQRNNLG